MAEKGTIENVQVFDRALSPDEVKSVMYITELVREITQLKADLDKFGGHTEK